MICFDPVTGIIPILQVRKLRLSNLIRELGFKHMAILFITSYCLPKLPLPLPPFTRPVKL